MDYLNSITIQAFIFFTLEKEFPLFHFKLNEVEFLIEDLKKYKIGKYFLFEGISDLFMDDLIDIKSDADRLFTKEKHQKFNILFNKISKSSSHYLLSFEDTLSLKEEFIVTNKLICRFNTLKLIDSKRQELLDFIDNYIEQYSEDNLESKINYYSKERSIEKVCKSLKGPYKDYGPKFRVNNKIITDNRIRLFELLLYLHKEGFIEIIDCNFLNDFNHTLNINIEWNKSPKEIQDIIDYWNSYGDLRINEADGIAFYKGNKLPFSRPDTKEFKLLKILMKDPGKKIPIDKIYSSIYEDEFNKRGNIKIITELVAQVREKIKINEDPKPTISLIVEGKSVLLIANPP